MSDQHITLQILGFSAAGRWTQHEMERAEITWKSRSSMPEVDWSTSSSTSTGMQTAYRTSPDAKAFPKRAIFGAERYG